MDNKSMLPDLCRELIERRRLLASYYEQTETRKQKFEQFQAEMLFRMLIESSNNRSDLVNHTELLYNLFKPNEEITKIRNFVSDNNSDMKVVHVDKDSIIYTFSRNKDVCNNHIENNNQISKIYDHNRRQYHLEQFKQWAIEKDNVRPNKKLKIED